MAFVLQPIPGIGEAPKEGEREFSIGVVIRGANAAVTPFRNAFDPKGGIALLYKNCVELEGYKPPKNPNVDRVAYRCTAASDDQLLSITKVVNKILDQGSRQIEVSLVRCPTGCIKIDCGDGNQICYVKNKPCQTQC